MEGELDLLTNNPSVLSINELMRTFGTTDFLVKQSIVPIVAWIHDESVMRTIGTGFFVSCSGYLLTACHVVLDPEESGYGKVLREGNSLKITGAVQMGVLVRINPASGYSGLAFLPFQGSWYWGDWKSSPLIHESDRFDILTYIAVCKVNTWPSGEGHQPLNLSLKPFTRNERSVVIGYAEMPDTPINASEEAISLSEPQDELFASVAPLHPTQNQQRFKLPVICGVRFLLKSCTRVL